MEQTRILSLMVDLNQCKIVQKFKSDPKILTLNQKFLEWEELILKNKSQAMEMETPIKLEHTFDNTHGTRIARFGKGLDSHEDGSS